MSVLARAVVLVFSDHTVMAQEKAKAETAKSELKTKAKERAPAPVIFENDRVGVVESRTKPGDRNPMWDVERVIYQFNAGETRIYYPDERTEDREFKAGTVEFFKRDTRSSENIGKTESHNLNVNLK